jgi:oligopeptide transport system permease protein
MIPVGELVLKKVLETLLALFALIFLSFLFMHLLPGGPFDEEVSFNPVVRESLQKLWALDQSFFAQFFYYLKQLCSGNLGESMIHTGTTVSELLSRGFLQTVRLNLLAVMLSFGGAFLTSALTVLYNGSWTAKGFQGLSLLGISLPSLFLGPVLIYFFGFYWNLLPTAFLTSPAHYILPVLTLSLRPWAQLNMILTNNLRETMNLDFIRTAKAKGLSRRGILLGHAVKNSLLPVLAISGPMIAALISGSFLVEILFSIHGLGQQFADSLNQRDYPVLLGLVLAYGVTLIVLTNIFELISQWVDPRTRDEA